MLPVRALLVGLLFLFGLSACEDAGDGKTSSDADGDGIPFDEDCNDDNDAVGAGSSYYPDTDGDGYGDTTEGVVACTQPSGYVETGGDCNDEDPAYHPGAAEDCTDPADYNCDGSVGYADADGDGVAACEDCDDNNAAIHPGAEEICNGLDDNCDGDIDETGNTTFYLDADGDGYGDPATSAQACQAPGGFVADGTDCDDNAAAVNPGAAELCNGIDDDCDGLIDEDALDATTWYGDGDGDGWGDDARTETSCEQPAGFVEFGGDCNDADAAYHPSATEECTDTEDYNCDGSVGYVDADGDGWAACEECDDGDASVHPGATEVCDGVDNDCDGVADNNAVDASTWYADADGDGYGDAASTVTECSRPSGYLADSTDCDDADAAVNPGAVEICDGIDNDCDGTTDESDALDASTWYTDADGDGYGDPATAALACDAPAGSVSDGTDCNDADPAYHPGATETCTDTEDYNCDGSTGYTDADGDGYAACEECDDSDASVNPGASELCNGIDDDCDGSIDEDATDPTAWYTDADGDGYGDGRTEVFACDAPAGTVANADDCDDSRSDVNPSEVELCDGVDNDCDGITDEDDAADASTWYADGDGDGYGDESNTTTACEAPTAYVSVGGDCDDTDAAYNPGATETCTDTVDYNCDGSIGYTDADGDGWAACEECDDGDASIFPGATEWCDGVDNDCDEEVDEADAADADTFYADSDGDGYGDGSTSETACSAPSGYTSDDSDCDDSDAAVNPSQVEVCNGIDDDCDGEIDENDAVDASTFYADADGDGYGDDTVTITACEAPAGYVAVGEDCNDSDPAYNPGASESCTDTEDYNCDGSVGFTDADGDGFAACEDCDDSDASTYPGADEYCDGVDNDCDGTVDEDAVDPDTFYADNDGDGYGDPLNTASGCEAPSGYVANGSDCDDTTADVNPGAFESCNGIDDDCDGEIDEDDAVDVTTFYADDDGDGYGDDAITLTACEAPSGYVAIGGDCDDSDAAYNPGASESCTDTEDYNCDGSVGFTDADGDGWAACVDCDDSDADIFPGATEWCDGVDNDCDGEVDEDEAVDASTFYADADGDTWGDSGSTTTACSAPSGYVSASGDCDDTDADVNPGAAEVCNGIDDDCDGTVDGSSATGGDTFYADADGDGYGDPSDTATACEAPSGYVSDADDCDDTDSDVHPGATEVCNGVDDDCDGTTDEGLTTTTYYVDADGDGYGDDSTAVESCSALSGYVTASGDCDDTDPAYNPGASESCTDSVDYNCDGSVGGVDSDGDGYYACEECDDSDASVFPGATEVCDGVDNDCDGEVDEADAVDASTWYADADGDGYGDSTDSVTACSAPAGYVADSSDCDDTDDTVHPGARETCNGVDDDCDGTADEGVKTRYYRDADGDGYGTSTRTRNACSVPSGYASNDDDCDDSDASINPAATEVCDGVDNDCDGSTDEGLDVTWYADADGDGYGDASTTTSSCSTPSGYVSDSDDCDDTDAAINPAATEVCDGVDNDCDGNIDESGGTSWYVDADGDGYGDASIGVTSCSAPTSYVSDDSDCDDGDASINPGATEVCDGVDNDCDGSIDEGTGGATWYADADGDGYGDASSGVSACSAPAGYVSDSSDCDDGDSAINPAATEVCDGVDNDCDGSIDEGLSATSYYTDADGDGYGDASTGVSSCSALAGMVTDDSDCDDSDAAINPAATEVCDGVDNDCDGSIDEGLISTYYADSDGDGFGDIDTTADACTAPAGYVENSDDCDDTDASVNPDATEVCNGIDDDCDGSIDEGLSFTTYYVDADGDGYGDSADSGVSTCSGAPSGYAATNDDCDDADDAIHPGATEECDAIDNDCDGSIDNGSTCPCPVEEYDGHAYMFCSTTANWTNARTTCRSYGYELVEINDDAENTWVSDTADSYSSSYWWIGLNDIATEGTYVWSTGASLTYESWASGEPSGSASKDCIQLRVAKYTWSDHTCGTSRRSICESY